MEVFTCLIVQLFNVITCMIPTIKTPSRVMIRLGVNSRFSWELEVCLTYGIVVQPQMSNTIMGAKIWSVQARSAVKQHNLHHLCRSAFCIVSTICA